MELPEWAIAEQWIYVRAGNLVDLARLLTASRSLTTRMAESGLLGDPGDMDSVHELRQSRAVAWCASIDLGIGDDDSVSGVAESFHATEQAAREWVMRELPRAEFPAWVAERRHGVAGAFLYGSVTRCYRVADRPEPAWEPDVDEPSWDADLVDGTVSWRKRA